MISYVILAFFSLREKNARAQVLNTARDESGTSAQVSLNERNAVKAMADAGSKGSFINISQVRACLCLLACASELAGGRVDRLPRGWY